MSQVRLNRDKEFYVVVSLKHLGSKQLSSQKKLKDGHAK